MDNSVLHSLQARFLNLRHNTVVVASVVSGLAGVAAIVGGFGTMFYHPFEGLGLLLGGYAATGLAIGAMAHYSLFNGTGLSADRPPRD